MIKTIQELQKEGWKKIAKDIYMLIHKAEHYLFYNEKTNVVSEHIWTKSFEKDLTGYIRMSLDAHGTNITKAKFYKTYGEENGKTMILIDLAKLYSENPHIYYSTENGRKVYKRAMITTDPGYLSGMKVVVEFKTEKIIGRHFDNVVSNLLDKSIISHTLDKKWLREDKLERISDLSEKEFSEPIQSNEIFELENIVDELHDIRYARMAPKYENREDINNDVQELKATGKSFTIGDIKAKLNK